MISVDVASDIGQLARSKLYICVDHYMNAVARLLITYPKSTSVTYASQARCAKAHRCNINRNPWCAMCRKIHCNNLHQSSRKAYSIDRQIATGCNNCSERW